MGTAQWQIVLLPLDTDSNILRVEEVAADEM